VANSAPAPKACIKKHGFIAEIIVGNYGDQEIYHCVIQREGSLEILFWGQEQSFERAMESAEVQIQRCWLGSAQLGKFY
jgi:hypothetical protein